MVSPVRTFSGIHEWTEDLFTNCYLQAAHNLGMTFEISDYKLARAQVYCGEQSVEVRNGQLQLNNEVALAIANHKMAAMAFLKGAGVPTPDSEIFKVSDGIEGILRRSALQYPLVVKPVYGVAGRGVTVDIRDDDELRRAIAVVEGMGKDRFLVERFIVGRDFRILAMHDEILDIVERIPAFVIGDGRCTARRLIEVKNRRRMEYHNSMEPIVIDDDLRQFLMRQDLKLSSILEDGRQVFLRGACNFALGGDLANIPLTRVPAATLDLFRRTQKALGLVFSGIDFIVPDLEAPLGPTNQGAVNEVNYYPGIDIHCLTEPEGVQTWAAEAVLRRHFGLKGA